MSASAGGESRPLRKGDSIDEKETVTTGKGGRVQMRFKDGAVVSLQPESSLRVDRYRYVGKGDAENKVGLSFLKGGLRTLSGAVGKQDPKAYRMDSPIATIGIRGTEYSLRLSGRLLGQVSAGAIEVCNSGGCLIVNAGEGFQVSAADQAPARYIERMQLPGRAGWQHYWQGYFPVLQAGRPGESFIPIEQLPSGLSNQRRGMSDDIMRFTLPPGQFE